MRNVGDRIDAVKLIPENATSAARTLLSNVGSLKPVQGVAATLKMLGDGVFGFVGKQAEITRRWMGEIR